jgi:glycosidase
MKKMIKIRKNNKLFDGDIELNIVESSDISVYSFYKENKSEKMVFIFNFSNQSKLISTYPYSQKGIREKMKDLITERVIDLSDDNIRLAPYEVLWLK